MKLSVFTKPWPNLTSEELGALVRSLGFDGVEFPLRKGFQAEPQDAAAGLARVAKALSAHGLTIMSVASELTEPVFAACRDVNCRILRIMLKSDPGLGYMKSEDKWLAQLTDAYPLCEKYGVKIGVQHHYGPGIFNTMELRHFLDRCDTRFVGAIWDAAHSGLAYEVPEQALDIIWDHLLLVNLKNAYVLRTGSGQYKPFFTTGQDGAASWPRIVAYLKARGYDGDICMPAEYTQQENELTYLKEDVAYLRSLL